MFINKLLTTRMIDRESKHLYKSEKDIFDVIGCDVVEDDVSGDVDGAGVGCDTITCDGGEEGVTNAAVRLQMRVRRSIM